MNTVPISELKQRTGKILHEAVAQRRDLIIERYGQEYAVILSMDRYRELVDQANLRIREQFRQARSEVFQETAVIPPEELKSLIDETVLESRRQRAGLDDASGN